jgi:hypothetical protein
MFNITNSAPSPLKGLAPDIPDNIISIIDRLLSKDREARYQQGRELVSALSLAGANIGN